MYPLWYHEALSLAIRNSAYVSLYEPEVTIPHMTGILCRSLEFILYIALFTLVLCTANSSSFDFLGLSVLSSQFRETIRLSLVFSSVYCYLELFSRRLD